MKKITATTNDNKSGYLSRRAGKSLTEFKLVFYSNEGYLVGRPEWHPGRKLALKRALEVLGENVYIESPDTKTIITKKDRILNNDEIIEAIIFHV